MSLVQQTSGRPPRRLLFWLTVLSMVVCHGSVAEPADPAPGKSLPGKSQLGSFPPHTAVFAAGCFWSAETDFEKAPGVVNVVAGYSGGKFRNPTYENYSSGGHREVILVAYDPNRVTYSGLVEYLLKHINPVDRGGSFIDRGARYTPAIYYANEEEKSAAQKVIQALDAIKVYRKPITVPLIPRGDFWPAEEYHQDYHAKNPAAYATYRGTCGRDEFVWKHWGDKAGDLTLPGAFPDRANTSPDRKNPGSGQSPGQNNSADDASNPWENFKKPAANVLRKRLSGIQFKVTQLNETEPAFHNAYWNHHIPGIYVDVVSGEPLFSSLDKFDSGTGWPSFVKPLVPECLVLREDFSDMQVRTEVRSKRGDSHLGHVFADGPPDRGGMRFCMNSGALRFIPKANLQKEGYGSFTILFEGTENKKPAKGKAGK